jgi:hypothetical protein
MVMAVMMVMIVVVIVMVVVVVVIMVMVVIMIMVVMMVMIVIPIIVIVMMMVTPIPVTGRIIRMVVAPWLGFCWCHLSAESNQCQRKRSNKHNKNLPHSTTLLTLAQGRSPGTLWQLPTGASLNSEGSSLNERPTSQCVGWFQNEKPR